MARQVNLDDLLPQDFVEKRTKEYESSELKKRKTTYWDFLGELMYFGGFEAVKAVMDDYITLDQAIVLLKGAKRMYNAEKYDEAIVSLAGNAGIHKAQEFNRLTKQFRE